jgi:hypothetical protein
MLGVDPNRVVAELGSHSWKVTQETADRTHPDDLAGTKFGEDLGLSYHSLWL